MLATKQTVMRVAGSRHSSRHATLHAEFAYCRRSNTFIVLQALKYFYYVMKRHSARGFRGGGVESLAVTKTGGTVWRRPRGCGWFCGRWSLRLGRRRSVWDTDRLGCWRCGTGRLRCWRCERHWHGRCWRGRLIWQYRCLFWLVLSQNCVNWSVSVLVLVSIWACIGMYFGVSIGTYWKYRYVLVCICMYHYLIYTKHQASTFPLYCVIYWVCIGFLIPTQYEPNTYILNTYLLVLNTCQYEFNTCHQYILQYISQYMTIWKKSIGMSRIGVYWHFNTCQHAHKNFTNGWVWILFGSFELWRCQNGGKQVNISMLKSEIANHQHVFWKNIR